MYRYTTPTLPLTFKAVDFTKVDKFRIALKQENQEHTLFIVDVNDSEVDAEKRTIYLSLTQEQTADLELGPAFVQARIVYTNGNVQATGKAEVTVKDVYDKEIV